MTVIAHISDLHFGRDVPAVTEGLLASLEAIQPELIIISGDLTQRAKTSEYKAGHAFLQRLHQPRFIIPGNHDMAAFNLLERFLATWGKWHQYVAQDLQPIMQTDAFMAVGINTTRRMGLSLDWSRGRIDSEQIRYVENMFGQTPDNCLRILVGHHPFWLPEGEKERGLVGGEREQALTAFQIAGVDLILGGHVHLAYVHPLHGMLVSHAGTTLSDRLIEGQPNSFNVIKGDRAVLQLEQMEWHDGEFTLARQQFFRRGEGGWQPHEDF